MGDKVCGLMRIRCLQIPTLHSSQLCRLDITALLRRYESYATLTVLDAGGL